MKLTCYALTENPPEIRPARTERWWMDEFPGRHPYRCLPLAIANVFGWEILSPCKLSIAWTGGNDVDDIIVRAHDDYPDVHRLVASHFSRGIVTFHTDYLFRTDPGYDLFVTGPLNHPKDGIAALTGIVETYWSPFTFTMNWKLMKPGVAQFEKGEPFCHIFPIEHGYLENVEPEIHNITENPELQKELDEWSKVRGDFIKKMDEKDPETIKQSWQKHYFHGKKPWEDSKEPYHINKLRVKEPLDKRKK